MCEASAHAAALCAIVDRMSTTGMGDVMLDLFWVYLVFSTFSPLA